MPNLRNLLRRRPLVALVVLILLLVIGYTARALDHRHRSLPRPPAHSAPAVPVARTAHAGGRFAANAAMPSLAAGEAK